MSRFYAPKENISKDKITIEGKEAHHILDVMRMKDGDEVVVFDGTGNEYSGFIKGVDPKEKKLIVQVVRVERPFSEKMPEVILAQAIPRKNKMEYIVEKSTELGVSRIVPIVTDRTIVRPDDARSKKKVAKWRRIALEASKQCGRTSVPKIEKVTDYKKFVKLIDQFDTVLFACLRDGNVPVREALDDVGSGRILVFIGPESDFTEEEIEMADRHNSRFISLGKRVLKSDTAGLFVLAVLNYEMGI
ncbi:MAG: 16S rRNA (uracil(1498)-N(3))-methyltransferase [Candidatus Omnitrophica bacterium]|nr:16S rRNA (uracil(1498)-N(3))-methyltransferase [Candidatus Omnitrophota bacterium]